jgi:hypothetical protein
VSENEIKELLNEELPHLVEFGFTFALRVEVDVFG